MARRAGRLAGCVVTYQSREAEFCVNGNYHFYVRLSGKRGLIDSGSAAPGQNTPDHFGIYLLRHYAVPEICILFRGLRLKSVSSVSAYSRGGNLCLISAHNLT